MPDTPQTNMQREQVLSTDITEVISYRPHWLIRRGNLLLLGLMMAAIASSMIIKYPDAKSGRVPGVQQNGHSIKTSKSLWHHFWDRVKQPG